MNVNERYLHRGLPEPQIDFLRGSALTPLAVDLCRSREAEDKLHIVSALATEGITIGVKHGLPALRITGPDGDGDYTLQAFNTELKKRGSRNVLSSKKLSYLYRHVIHKLRTICNDATASLDRQLNCVFDSYQYTVRAEHSYDQSQLRLDMYASDFQRLYQAIHDGNPLSALSTAEQSRLAATFQTANEKVASAQSYVGKMAEFVQQQKFIAGWCPRGIYFGVIKLHLNGAHTPRLQSWIEPLEFYRNWAALEEHRPELKREAFASLAFLKAHRESTAAVVSRDPEKLFPAGDFAFPSLNAVAYFTSTINRRLPQWLVLDRLVA